MTTPENSTETPAPFLSGLSIFNLGISLVASVLMIATISLAGGLRSEGLGKTAMIFPILVVLLSVASAMISIWHNQIPSSRDGFKKSIGLTSWILTFVTLGFGVLMLLLMLIAVFSL